ncbi:MAG: ImcF-related family protein, partial [Brucella intermedia]
MSMFRIISRTVFLLIACLVMISGLLYLIHIYITPARELSVFLAISTFAVLIVGVVIITRRMKRFEKGLDTLDSPINASAQMPASLDSDVITLKHQLGRRRLKFLLGLPRFLVIGSSRSEKHAIVYNSDLKFDWKEKQDNDCRFHWFIDQNAFILIAKGQDEQESGSIASLGAEFVRFFRLLGHRGHRRRINGIIAAVSVEDALEESIDDYIKVLDALITDIEQIYREIGQRIPIYFFCNNVDRLSGFNAFFSGINEVEREQVWGVTIPASTPPEQMPVLFTERLLRLRDPLDQDLLRKLQFQSELVARGEIVSFLGDATRLFDRLRFAVEHLASTLSGLPFPVMLRGVYMCAAAPKGESRAYFVSRFFRRLLFVEADLVHYDRRVVFRRYTLLSAAALLTCIMCAGIVYMSWTYRQQSLAFIDAFESDIDIAKKMMPPAKDPVTDMDFLKVLPFLERLRLLSDETFDRVLPHVQEAPARFSVLSDAQQKAYSNSLEVFLLPRLIFAIGKTIRSQSDANEVFDALKLYRMLIGDLVMDPIFASSQAQRMVVEIYPGDQYKSTRHLLFVNLCEIFERGLRSPTLPEDLLVAAEDKARSVGVIQRAFYILKQKASEISAGNWTALNQENPNAKLLESKSGRDLYRKIPLIFTGEGFQNSIVPQMQISIDTALSDVAILDKNSNATRDHGGELDKDVYGLYFEEFRRIWSHAFQDLRLRRPDNIAQAEEITRTLSEERNPLIEILKEIAEATNLTASSAESLGLVDATQTPIVPIDPYGQLRDALMAFKGNGNSNAPSSTFADLQRLFAELNLALSQLSRSSDPFQELMDKDSKINDANQKIYELSRRLPPPASQLIGDFNDAVISHTLELIRTIIRSRWAGDGRDFCQLVVNGNFPFDKTASRDASIADFTTLFKPGGTLDSFFHRYMEPFVDTTGSPWRWRNSD